MTFSDLVAFSAGNLWRMKLRASLTIAGVVIAIAAFVAMLSFGAGNQEYVTQQYNDLGLFNTILVYPLDKDNESDSIAVAVLDNEAVDRLSLIPGVRLAYPFDNFSVTVSYADTQISTTAQALPAAAVGTRLYSQLLAGSPFSDDSTNEALVTADLLKMLGIDSTETLVGQPIEISVRLASLDSGLAGLMQDEDGSIRKRLSDVRIDSLLDADYRQKVARRELQAAMGRFLNGFMKHQIEARDTLTVRGVLKKSQGGRARTEPIIIPVATAQRFTSSGISTDPAELLASFGRGELFSLETDLVSKSFPRVTLDIDPYVSYQSVKDSVTAMGFRVFSYAEEFAEIRKFFFYFDVVLGVIGTIALITASLGIVNTMIMSIMERTREIGILKALGSDDRDIRILFLVESGVIGAVGGILGIVFGWIITRIASLVVRTIMAREGLEGIEMFALPVWLIVTAFLFGLIVSVLAGSYPARRAARVDPVVALRNE